MFANKLKKGDTIGVVCPSDKINDEDIPEIKEAERDKNIIYLSMHLKGNLEIFKNISFTEHAKNKKYYTYTFLLLTFKLFPP